MAQLLSAISPENIKDFLQAYFSLPQTQSPVTDQTATVTATAKTSHATRRKKKTKTATAATTAPTSQPEVLPASTTQSGGIAALAQIDTGCQVGDVINRRVLRGLRGETHLRDSDNLMWMCSGLNNQCVESTTVLDVVVSFKKKILLNTHFELPVRIANESKVNLILGLETIKNLNLVKVTPEFF